MNRGIKNGILIIVLLIMVNSIAYGASEPKRIKIALFLTRGETDMFWGKFRDFMSEAVNDFGMEMKVFYANGDHLKMLEQVRGSANGYYSFKPDIAVIQNFKGQGKYALKICEEAKLPVFVVNTGFLPNDKVGEPREKYRYWIGEMTPDDVGAGMVLANVLLSKAPENADKQISVLGLEGVTAEKASNDRVEGLKKAVAKKSVVRGQSVSIADTVSASWDAVQAAEKVVMAKKEWKIGMNVVWCASDGMAVGAVKASRKLGLMPGKDVVIGGVDWSEEGLQEVMAGEMAASVGGHFMEGAWAAALIYDYFNGADFASEGVKYKSPMYAITQENYDSYMEKIEKGAWDKINFKKFSKKLNPELKSYKFGMEYLY